MERRDFMKATLLATLLPWLAKKKENEQEQHPVQEQNNTEDEDNSDFKDMLSISCVGGPMYLGNKDVTKNKYLYCLFEGEQLIMEGKDIKELYCSGKGKIYVSRYS